MSLLRGRGGEYMVIKKGQLNVKKELGAINSFEKILFITISSLSLLFLLVTCWMLLTGDELIFLHGSQLTPQHLCMIFYVQSFFIGKKMAYENIGNSDMQQLMGSF
jgi:hypothetical protein